MISAHLHQTLVTLGVSLVAPAASSVVWFFILRRRVAAAYARGYRAGAADQLAASSRQLSTFARLSTRFRGGSPAL